MQVRFPVLGKEIEVLALRLVLIALVSESYILYYIVLFEHTDCRMQGY